jgi:hypothetical protein
MNLEHQHPWGLHRVSAALQRLKSPARRAAAAAHIINSITRSPKRAMRCKSVRFWFGEPDLEVFDVRMGFVASLSADVLST